mmetsp:Transcript_10703/g.22824  ORF Transcript_10703/g.22824 Transcript_10703/m.22824 type:complete len:160 (+) Transcript_10703:32-511(+)|eukprot:CAMPEP_0168184190 /NCGR_PEP_ID=MMETSP0139_2-20121125/13077_1 /TAXON_ID=44445 /ORGANISM="Pseudo-nitzschia australis, Strain 10249 10 AB" /LENGTH=159 /DNA_ID=CAMNT_0008105735 /DNA_START=40 /DNA_END=519 /DNA_ORIENTATION=+
MSTGKAAEWTVHTSRRSRHPATATATVTPPARKPNPIPTPTQSAVATFRKPNPIPKPKPIPKPTSAVAIKVDAEQANKDTESNTSSVSSISDDDRYTKTVKDFVPVAKLVPITNQVTSNDVHTFRQTISDSLARISSRYTDEVALTGGYAFLVEKELNY